MTVDEIEMRVGEIRAMDGDPERAHSNEDDLHQQVLAAIANGECADPAECAKAALETLEIKFARWCA